MRFTRKLFVFTAAILALVVLAPSVPEAEEPQHSRTLTVTKECGTAILAPGELGYCTVLESNFRPLIGAKIRYFGPGFFAADHPFLDSRVVIESARGGGGTAFGHCLVRGVPDVLGACQFTGGSGSLQGFKADVTVTIVGGTIWEWEGIGSLDEVRGRRATR